MIEHSTNLSELSGIVRQTYFYKAPTPLLIGNLPFGDDFEEKRGEYEYLDYYILPSNTAVKYDGFLFYSKFLKNYMFLSYDYASWSFMYPNFRTYEGPYALNPFVNDTNGACAWSTDIQRRNSSNIEIVYSSTKIYYNFTTGRYEKGLGEDTFNFNGTWHPLGEKNLSNGFYDYGSGSQTGSMHFSHCTTFNGLRNFKYDSPQEEGRSSISYYQIGVGKYFTGDSSVSATVDFSNLANRDNLDKAYKEIAISDNFSSVFPSYSTYQGIFKFDDQSSLNSPQLQYFYERLDLIKDLDYEDEPNKYEKICGIYENNSTQTGYYNAFALGSIVIGNEQHRDDIGWFIGINHAISEIGGFVGQSSSTGQDLNRIQATNVISLLRDDHLSFYTSLGNYNLIITLGYAWKSEEKKYLVYYVTKDTDQESIYRRFRLYIVDKDPSLLFSQRKLWYVDLPVDETGWTTTSPTTMPPELFRYPYYFGYYGVNSFTDLEFNYINLDDENDTKEPVKFSMLGAVRENAQQQMLGFPINKQYMEARSFDGYKRSNAYIGYWDAPIVNFAEEE